MEPQIQYCKTSDGVNIAYWTMGEGGVPLVASSPALFSHIALEVRDPRPAAWYERVASRRMIVRFDPRNSGMSQRGVEDLTLDALALDVLAVVDHLGLERVDLVGFAHAPMAAFAAHWPERVRRLILAQVAVRYSELHAIPRAAAVSSLAEQDWDLYTETLAHTMLGWKGTDAHTLALFARESVRQEDWVRLLSAQKDWDLGPYLPNIGAPTLLVRSEAGPFLLPEQAKELAAGIPSARLVQLDGGFTPVDNPVVADLIEDFLKDDGESGRTAATQQAPPSGTAIILFADIADSTGLTERLGDAAFRDKARALDASLREVIRSNGGTAIDGKLLGDGVLAVFGAAREAIACARDIHRLARESSPPPVGEGPGEGSALLLHVGIHAGDVIREEGNVYGGAVNIASRVASEAAAGETLVSGTVRDLARTSAGVSFEDRGERDLKGIKESVRVWAVV
ncbi:MAG: adenylate/guanylate cyclase domain-containing protein [Dehalococcoidia bacterium]